QAYTDRILQYQNQVHELHEAQQTAENTFSNCLEHIMILAFYSEGDRLIDGLREFSKTLASAYVGMTHAVGEYQKFVANPSVDRCSTLFLTRQAEVAAEIEMAVTQAIVHKDEGETLRKLFSSYGGSGLQRAMAWRAVTSSYSASLD